jgi:hypothetical protein
MTTCELQTTRWSARKTNDMCCESLRAALHLLHVLFESEVHTASCTVLDLEANEHAGLQREFGCEMRYSCNVHAPKSQSCSLLLLWAAAAAGGE